MSTKKYQKKRNYFEEFDLIKTIILFAPILGGCLSVFSNILLCLICICGIVYKSKQSKKFKMPTGINAILILIYVFSFIPVTFFAVDKGMTMMGFFKNASIILFMLLYQQYSFDENEYKKNLDVFSFSAVISVILSLILALFGMDEIFTNNRFQGIFGYANSYGMFLLIGVIIILAKEQYTKYDFINLLILALGIVLTNSRAIIILTIIAAVIVLIFNKQNRKNISLICGIFIIIWCFFSFNGIMEKRLDSEMLQSSEFVTRALYYHDAVNMIKENPFGYGYMGWYYGQAKEQTAMYYTKFVHNSVLQVVLDVGIIPFICLLILFVNTFFSKKQNYLNRLILVLLLGHSIIDLDLEYMIFIFMIIMMLPTQINEFKNLKLVKMIMCSLGIIFSWLTLGTLLYEIKAYEASHALVPFYTDAMHEDIYSVSSPEKQLKVAKKIYKLNKNSSGVYEAFSNECVKNGEYDKALEYEKERLKLNKYTQENYFIYMSFLNDGIEYYSQIGNKELLLKFMNEVCEIEDIINETLENTNELSYKTIHPPEIKVTEDMKNFIKQVENAILNIA